MESNEIIRVGNQISPPVSEVNIIPFIKFFAKFALTIDDELVLST